MLKLTSKQIRSIREAMDLPCEEFVLFFNQPITILQGWENGSKRPHGMDENILSLIACILSNHNDFQRRKAFIKEIRSSIDLAKKKYEKQFYDSENQFGINLMLLLVCFDHFSYIQCTETTDANCVFGS